MLNRRHLLRLWLRDPEYEWKTPEGLRERFANVYDGVTPEKQVFPLEPRIRSSSDGNREYGKANSGSNQ